MTNKRKTEILIDLLTEENLQKFLGSTGWKARFILGLYDVFDLSIPKGTKEPHLDGLMVLIAKKEELIPKYFLEVFDFLDMATDCIQIMDGPFRVRITEAQWEEAVKL